MSEERRPVCSLRLAAQMQRMKAKETPSGAKKLVARIARCFLRGQDERYLIPDNRLPAISALIEQAANGPGAVREIGGVLKLIRLLRGPYASPTAAAAMVGILRRSPQALRVVRRHWSGAPRPRFGADLQPLAPARAPQMPTSPVQDGGLTVASFLTPGREARSEHARRQKRRS
jgi:hypothetical protein